jgi:phospholipid/cholesterol/gamma-HCH transport system ATP-binding protein
VLKGINLRIEEGEVLALIGPSGYGKSVLLKHIMGLMKPDRGTVLIKGRDINKIKGKALNDIKAQFGVLFQGGALFDSLTVYDNVAFPLVEKTKLNPMEVRERVMRELEQVGLKGMENKYPAEISGGMKKRVAMARAIIMEPKIVFFDEPTTGLDPIITKTIQELIQSCHRRFGFTAIIVTHEVPSIFKIVDRVAMLHDGAILEQGTPEEVLASPSPIVQEFLS